MKTHIARWHDHRRSRYVRAHTVRTLRRFTSSYLEVVRTVHDIVLPDPDRS